MVTPSTISGVSSWGNGDPSRVEWTDFGIHDITCNIALTVGGGVKRAT